MVPWAWSFQQEAQAAQVRLQDPAATAAWPVEAALACRAVEGEQEQEEGLEEDQAALWALAALPAPAAPAPAVSEAAPEAVAMQAPAQEASRSYHRNGWMRMPREQRTTGPRNSCKWKRIEPDANLRTSRTWTPTT